MALDLGFSLLEQGGVEPAALARRFAESYRASRGYGPGTARILKRIRRGMAWEEAARSVYPEGSFGNGAAMRAPVLALYFTRDESELKAANQAQARVTHGHPLAIEGAWILALATRGMLLDLDTPDLIERVTRSCILPEFQDKLSKVKALLDRDLPKPAEVVRTLGNGVTALASCPTALYLGLAFRKRPFMELMDFARACRGDVDTISAMAGALWGAANGSAALPETPIEGRDRIMDLAKRLHERNQPPRISSG